MSMSVYKLVGLRRHGRFYTDTISKCHQQSVSKGIVFTIIPIIGRVITIWYKFFFNIRVFFGGLVSRKKVFLEYSHPIIHILMWL